MKIIIETIPHQQQRYPTVGDWIFDKDGTLHITVSDMGDDRYEFLVGVHEAVEAFLCRHRGISEESITEFDIKFEKNRQYNDISEPGDNPLAPYRKEHFFATSIERLIAAELKVDWFVYDETVVNL
jgi:hypothetical protein